MSFFNYKNIRKQCGFTLLELLIVIAVIGILASLAVPKFQNYIMKARFVELINVAAPYKTAVEICIQRTNDKLACDAGAEGVPAAVTTASGVIAKTAVEDGAITITGTTVVDGKTYILTPTVNAGAVSWSQTGDCVAASLCEP